VLWAELKALKVMIILTNTFVPVVPGSYISLAFLFFLKKDVLGVVADIKSLKQASQTNRSLIRDITIKDSRSVHTPL
jgi:hypothetical protein